MAINLLPPKEKKRIQKVYKARRLRATAGLVIALGVVSVIMLVPTYLLSESTKTLAENKKQELLNEEGNLNPEKIKEDIFLINKKARSLAQNEYTKVYEVFTDITQGKRSGISITGLAFNIKEEAEQIDIVGNANNRETLLSFRRDLEQKDYISKVELPVSNFTQNVDINFSIKITLDNE